MFHPVPGIILEMLQVGVAAKRLAPWGDREYLPAASAFRGRRMSSMKSSRQLRIGEEARETTLAASDFRAWTTPRVVMLQTFEPHQSRVAGNIGGTNFAYRSEGRTAADSAGRRESVSTVDVFANTRHLRLGTSRRPCAPTPHPRAAGNTLS